MGGWKWFFRTTVSVSSISAVRPRQCKKETYKRGSVICSYIRISMVDGTVM